MRSFCKLCILLLLVAFAAGSVNSAELTYVDLVKKLTDMEALSVLPEKGETCALFSSYDRASRYDTATGKYVGWDANGDNNGIIRTEGDLQVLAEMNGPGCIWRIWSAAPGDGHVKIYLDGASEPAVDLTCKDYFSGSVAPFNYPSLVHYTALGANNYVPIPYQKSCKILAENNWGAYYQFTYSTFPSDTKVPTFKRDLSANERLALSVAEKKLRDGLGSDPVGQRLGENKTDSSMTVPAGKTVSMFSIEGPRAITAMMARVNDVSVKQIADVLRQVVIRISWDGEKSPSVWCPLGDFFGSAPGINNYKSLPLGMADNGFYSYWYMPFAKSAVIEIVNESDQDVNLNMSITDAPLTQDVKSLGRFHAKWHRDMFLPVEPERRAIDWPMLKVGGRGRFCGVMLHVFNPNGGWWGEGDEKFFVDDEKFPSTIGTGSEDYFGYAWCNPQLFYNAYHNQTLNQGDNFGNVSVNRWHISDNVPFQTMFEADIEKYFPNDRPTLYAAVAYWYQSTDGIDPYLATPVSERIGYCKYEIPVIEGAIEGETLKVLGKTGGKTETQGLPARQWSRAAQLWWTEGKPGDKLDLAIPVEKAGDYDFRVRMTKANDYAIVQFYLDGNKLGDPIDLYNTTVAPTDEVSFGNMNLTQGEHKLTVELIGANDAAQKSYMFGLDYVLLGSTAP